MLSGPVDMQHADDCQLSFIQKIRKRLSMSGRLWGHFCKNDSSADSFWTEILRETDCLTLHTDSPVNMKILPYKSDSIDCYCQ